MGVGNYISSDTFFVGGHLWEIRFYPDRKRNDVNGDIYVSLFIALVSKCEGGVDAYFEYVLFDQSGNKWHKQRDAKFAMGSNMSGPHTVTFKVAWGYESFYKRTELEASQFIKDDCLTIQCTVGMVNKSISLPLSNLGQSYGQLLESKEESDVSFEVEGEVFYAHKLIISTRSPVFKAQFFGPLKEENTHGIKIEEMQAPVFKAVLHFIYCDIMPYVEEELAGLEATVMTQHLLAAADRYGIERLKSLCETRLCGNIDIDTVASSLALAEQHGCILLKSACLEFIGLPENLEGVMQTDGFKNLKKNYPAVIDELLKSVARITYVSYGPGIEEIENALLHFIYFDVVPDVEEELAGLEATMMTQYLLAAAYRFGIERLRSLCETRLCENIAIDTVASSLALAEQHAVMQTDGFKNLKENYPTVIDDLLKSVARVTYVSYGPGIEDDASRKP
ncbi:hypothetical protein RD792_002016 [Penstemon davidsonii]|uniref:Uncharacterized protein n=1 Tax=Penstemon davidsonii TaxID=160366 RepID=A0ABR0DPZ0_9LAMI|nr:hypothetical protein RD792_002016 [Penstemon davidsonii]